MPDIYQVKIYLERGALEKSWLHSTFPILAGRICRTILCVNPQGSMKSWMEYGKMG